MIAAGFKYHDKDEEHEVVVIGRGDRKHVDEIVRRAPREIRDEVVDYFKPMVEGGYPVQGKYLWRPHMRCVILWWKHCAAVLS